MCQSLEATAALEPSRSVFEGWVMAVAGARVWRPGRRKAHFARLECLLAPAILCVGALIESGQARFTTTRRAELSDWVAEVLGVVLAFGLNKVSQGARRHRCRLRPSRTLSDRLKGRTQ